MTDKVSKLKELKELLDSGVLTQEEFEAEKKAILAGGSAAKPPRATIGEGMLAEGLLAEDHQQVLPPASPVASVQPLQMGAPVVEGASIRPVAPMLPTAAPLAVDQYERERREREERREYADRQDRIERQERLERQERQERSERQERTQMERMQGERSMIANMQSSGIVQQPGMIMGALASIWNGVPPPKQSASSWFGMYKPDEGRGRLGPDGHFMSGQEPEDCGDCCFASFCAPFAAGELMEWATGKPAWIGCMEFACFGTFFLAPCIVVDARKKMEEKIHSFHLERGGALLRVTPISLNPVPRARLDLLRLLLRSRPLSCLMRALADQKAQMMPPNTQAHDQLCCCLVTMFLIPCGVCTLYPLITWVANIENYVTYSASTFITRSDVEVLKPHRSLRPL